MTTKNVGEHVDARCTRCGGRNMQITVELKGTGNYEVQAGKVCAVKPADALKATGRLYGRCRKCGHDWVFRKNPLAS